MLRGGAAYFFLEHTASTDIQRLDLSDEELEHLKLEFCVMAMGMLSMRLVSRFGLALTKGSLNCVCTVTQLAGNFCQGVGQSMLSG